VKGGSPSVALSVRERIALHIYSTLVELGGKVDSQLLTQAGIADSLLITRAHAAMELERGIRKGVFTSGLAKPRGSERELKVYTLTAGGYDIAKTILEMAEKERIVKVALTNPGALPVSQILGRLDSETIIRLGALRLAYHPLNASAIGIKKRIPLTLFKDGMISISNNAAGEIDQILTDEKTVKLSYSMLADYSLRCGDYAGRMKYLALSGRYREADRAAIAHCSEIEFGSDGPLTDLLCETENFFGFGPDFHFLLARLCIRDGRADTAVNMSRMAGKGTKGLLVLAESMALAENARESMNILNNLKNSRLVGGDLSALHRIRARLSLVAGDLENAIEEISTALRTSTRSYEQSETRLNYELLAKIERMRGNYSEASRAESKLRSLLEFGTH
jgi:tetratricopeptide (TPR) repeat protein